MCLWMARVAYWCARETLGLGFYVFLNDANYQNNYLFAAPSTFLVLGLSKFSFLITCSPFSCSLCPMWDVIQLTLWHECCHVPSLAPPYLEPTSAKSSRNASPIPSQRYDFMEGQFSSPRPSMSLSFVLVNMLYCADNLLLHELLILFLCLGYCALDLFG